jgi:tetratricopeptide (TPR) repeat protein
VKYLSYRVIFSFLFLAVTQSCAQLGKPKTFNHYPEFGSKPNLPSKQSLLEVDSQSKENFLNYYETNLKPNKSKSLVLATYIKTLVSDFNYDSSAFSTSESLAKKKGNALTFALLSTSLADLIDIKVTYEMMDSPYSYENGERALNSQHINSLIHQTKHERDVYRNGQSSIIKIDFFPNKDSYILRKIHQSEIISMYFQNKAAEALLEKNYSRAYWLAKESLVYSKNNIDSLNILGMVYEDTGYNQDANSVYEYALELSPTNIDALTYYHEFLVKNKFKEKAIAIKDRIDNTDIADPFSWIRNGDLALSSGDYDQAITHYKKVIELTPYLHQAHFGLAQANLLKGNIQKAQDYFTLALEHSDNNKMRYSYQNRLAELIK